VRIACITDLHGATAALERILDHAGPVDAVLLGGDITHFGSPIDAQRAVEVAQRKAPLVLAVVGNTDSVAIQERLIELGVSFHGRGILLRSGQDPARDAQASEVSETSEVSGGGPVGLHGLSGIPPWKRGMYGLGEEELAAALESGYAEIAGCKQHILLAHVPPHGLGLDLTSSGVHAGSRAVRAFVEKRQPALVFCGHVHEGRGTERLGPSTVVNCGRGAAGEYALVEAAEEVRVELREA
jgi:hypothetical protein